MYSIDKTKCLILVHYKHTVNRSVPIYSTTGTVVQACVMCLSNQARCHSCPQPPAITGMLENVQTPFQDLPWVARSGLEGLPARGLSSRRLWCPLSAGISPASLLPGHCWTWYCSTGLMRPHCRCFHLSCSVEQKQLLQKRLSYL